MINLLIDPDSDKFMWWLKWLVDEKQFTANEIIDSMYGSYKKYYQDLQLEYIKWNEKER